MNSASVGVLPQPRNVELQERATLKRMTGVQLS